MSTNNLPVKPTQTRIRHTRSGRPTKYDIGIANEICNVLATSSKGTKKLCSEKPHWPCQDTLFRWLKENSEFSEQYRQAKQYQAETLADEILNIADDTSKDTLTSEDGRIVINQTAINRAKIQIDARKWLASKLAPKVYGNSNKFDNSASNHMSHEDYVRLLAVDCDK